MPPPTKWAQDMADFLVKLGEMRGLKALKEERVGPGRSCRIDVVWWAPIPSLLLNHKSREVPLVTFEIQYSKSIPSISHGVLKSMKVHPALHTVISFYPLSEGYKKMLRAVHPSGLQIFDGDRAIEFSSEVIGEIGVATEVSFWKELSSSYDELLGRADSQGPLKNMRLYEEFETLQIDRILEGFLANRIDFTYVELGSATGSGLMRYALKIDKLGDPDLLTYDSRYDRFLKLIIGVESSSLLVEKCMKRFSEHGIDQLLGERILLVQAFPTQSILSVERLPKLGRAIVCCRFNLLGNLVGNNMRMQMLKNVRSLIGSKGIAVVSVFNSDYFQKDGIPFYTAVRDAIGSSALLDFQSGDLRTDRGFQSHWFAKEEVAYLFKKCGLVLDEVVRAPSVGMIVTGTR